MLSNFDVQITFLIRLSRRVTWELQYHYSTSHGCSEYIYNCHSIAVLQSQGILYESATSTKSNNDIFILIILSPLNLTPGMKKALERGNL